MDLQTIFSWFKRGCKPTEAQFKATFLSFRHKDDPVPMEDVSGLSYALATKSNVGHTHTLAEISDYDGGDKEVLNAMVAQNAEQLETFTKIIGMYYIQLDDVLLYRYEHDEDTDTDVLNEVEPDGKVVYSAYDVDEHLHIYLYNVPNMEFQDVTDRPVDKTIYTSDLDTLVTRQLENGVYSVVYINSDQEGNTFGDAYTLTVGDGSISSRVLECRTGWAQTVLVDENYQWQWHRYSYNGHTHQMSDVEGLGIALGGKAAANHNHDGVYQPAGSYAAADHTHSQYLTQHQDISGKQDKTDNSLLTTVKTIVGAINELWNKFADYALSNHNHDGVYQPAGNYAAADHTHSQYLTQHQDISGKQDKTDNSLLTTVKTIVGAINELWNKFADYALANHNHNGVYQPAGDYASRSHGHAIGAIEGLSDALAGKAASNHNHDGVYQPVGNYLTQHQDISGKQDKTDNTLPTTSKTIVGAIAELWNKFTDYLKGIQHVTYAQLVTLRNNSGLVAGQWYRITDYMTTVANDTEARSAGHPFDLLVMATSSNTLSEEAKAIKSSRDSNGYFTDANLNAWKVWYSLDNDATRFQWADTENGKGVIWRMIDEWQNDCPYDFKNVQFKRYKATALSEVLEEAIDGQYYAYNGDMMNVEIEDEEDFVWAYTFTLIDENEDWVDYSIKKEGALDPESDWGYLNQFKKGRCEYNRIRHSYTAVTIDDECYRTLMLNNIVLISTINEECGLSGEMQLNEFGVGNYNMTVKDNPEKNVFGNKCYNNIVGSYGNTFGNDCYENTFGNGCYRNTFGNYFQCNTFGNDCCYNTFGNGCWYNTFGNGCGGNTFGNDCGGNTFGNDCYNNTFGNNVHDNTFGNYCYSNTFGNNCRYLTVHNGVRYVEVLGGNTDSAYVQNAQILNGTHGSDSSNRLQISFQEDADYCQYAGLNSSGNLRIWTPADAA